MFGREAPIRAEVVQLAGFSGHADAGELLDWMRTAPSAPRVVYPTHGEPDAADTLRARVQRELGWRARVPEHLEQVGLEDARCPRRPRATPACASPVPASTPPRSRWP